MAGHQGGTWFCEGKKPISVFKTNIGTITECFVLNYKFVLFQPIFLHKSVQPFFLRRILIALSWIRCLSMFPYLSHGIIITDFSRSHWLIQHVLDAWYIRINKIPAMPSNKLLVWNWRHPYKETIMYITYYHSFYYTKLFKSKTSDSSLFFTAI